ncbi:hypothetical protein Cflav_PD3097 [Pedosphaera parvula Ellin514]|uniref:Glycosyltransferase RgtA/B/C/D-like domain-containing protein n=1 Tax=Pedosphaera parvula (strain Ellin514) TaxID=320771 RepID=B9XJH7_PEDPL|nr:hypothetical protein Cflav_PD3097 [Pedosphaera parvula Ellin514]
MATTLLVVWLHVAFLLHAGGLWRDETNSVNLATLPSLSDALRHDSSPLLWTAVLRLWTGLGGGSDSGMRALGFLVGLALLGLLWFNARQLKISFPLISLLLLGFSSTVIRWGDSIRAWGLGACFVLLTFALIWKVIESPTKLNVLMATLAALGSVHCTYYNSVLLFAIGLGAIAVALRNRLWKRAALVVGIGTIAAISLLPYLGTIRSGVKDYGNSQISQFSFETFSGQLFNALAPRGELPTKVADAPIRIWIALWGIGIAIALWCQYRPARFDATPRQKDLLLFSVTSLLVGLAAYFLFLDYLKLSPQVWYYLALMTLTAISLDAIQSVIANNVYGRNFRLLFVVLLMVIMFFSARQTLNIRQTNIDLATTQLNKIATKNDFILVNHWFYGVSFQRYYSGPAPWLTIPVMDDHKFHRYDLFAASMEEPDPLKPMQPVLDKIAHTLQSGGSVWVIGWLEILPEDVIPAPAPIAFHGEAPGSKYYRFWSEQTAHFIRTHSLHTEELNIPSPNPVSDLEHVGLLQVTGWKTDSKIQKASIN